MQLDPIAVEAGVRLESLARVGSTNQVASERGRHGARGPLWITAQSQTAGRGRRGRSWYSPPGNLYASLLLSDPAPFEHAPELAFVAALALRDSIIADAPALAQHLRFKWPNDLLLKGGKCAGILIEGEVEPDKSATVVVGIGANCVHHPPDAADGTSPGVCGGRAVLYPATDLAAHGAPTTPQQLFQRLSAAMCLRIAQWDRGRAFSTILGDWLSAAAGIGEEIHVRNGNADKVGRFVGLDQSGRLVLEGPGGTTEKISAGDVFPLTRRGGQRLPNRQGP
jgi:BirA family transcriptional regulator, biotin operon repressor / biotin---[acetyl-CoA-carboxylase] ligase